MPPSRYPLTAFQTWMQSRSVAPSTIFQYATRIRAVLGHLKCDPANDADTINRLQDVEAVRDYLRTLSMGTRSTTISAWTAYSTWLQEHRVSIPSIKAPTRGSIIPHGTSEPPSPRFSVPPPVVIAVWDVFRRYERDGRKLAPTTFYALRWADIVWEPFGRRSPEDAYACSFTDPGGAGIYAFHRPVTAWRELWRWAGGGDAPVGHHPVVAHAPRSVDPLPLEELHAILALGRRERIPLLREPVEPPAAPSTVDASVAAARASDPYTGWE